MSLSLDALPPLVSLEELRIDARVALGPGIAAVLHSQVRRLRDTKRGRQSAHRNARCGSREAAIASTLVPADVCGIELVS